MRVDLKQVCVGTRESFAYRLAKRIQLFFSTTQRSWRSKWIHNSVDCAIVYQCSWVGAACAPSPLSPYISEQDPVVVRHRLHSRNARAKKNAKRQWWNPHGQEDTDEEDYRRLGVSPIMDKLRLLGACTYRIHCLSSVVVSLRVCDRENGNRNFHVLCTSLAGELIHTFLMDIPGSLPHSLWKDLEAPTY